jgi:hypothetical protein
MTKDQLEEVWEEQDHMEAKVIGRLEVSHDQGSTGGDLGGTGPHGGQDNEQVLVYYRYELGLAKKVWEEQDHKCAKVISKLKHPMTKDQLEEVWEEQDLLDAKVIKMLGAYCDQGSAGLCPEGAGPH